MGVENIKEIGKEMMAESKFFMGYSRWDEEKGAYETWEEAVDRVMSMHKTKYQDKMTPELEELMEKASEAYKNKLVLGAQRALQFGGEQLLRHQARNYNCSASYVDRPEFFQETMYLLLCGVGVGFSVQKRHVSKLPKLAKRYEKRVKVFQVEDSIEGWSDAFGVLLSSFLSEGNPFPQYKGVQVHFDFSKIRPAGAMISGGFKAPGPEGLRKSLLKCEELLEKQVEEGNLEIRPIVAYDFVMHMADAVLSGGVRRSATIALFDKDDEEMLNAKTGTWYIDNPQRGRSNNSVMLKRDELTREEWAHIMNSVRDYGEPGFVLVDDYEFLTNPCVEIGLYGYSDSGESGFQFCNLTEIAGGACVSEEVFLQACEAASILGTLQAGYTDFKYVGSATKEITERESLLGVSITGWMNNPDILFNEGILRKGAEKVKETNRKMASLLGINEAARTTCVKPSGNASVLLGCASGIHGEHSPYYFRNVQINELDEVSKLMLEVNPKMVEKSVSSSTDNVISFPVVSKEGSVYKKDLLGVKQLEYVKKAQQTWVEAGTVEELCIHPGLRHNVSNTISVDDWDEVEQYIFDNREHFAGISLLSTMGDKGYAQAPFTEVLTKDDILKEYGVGAMFASGLIVDALSAFDNNLWLACDIAMSDGKNLTEDRIDLLKRDWVRRFKKFSENYMGGSLVKTSFCLKDCYNLHKWESIMRSMKFIDFSKTLSEPRYVDADTIASEACQGGACEISF